MYSLFEPRAFEPDPREAAQRVCLERSPKRAIGRAVKGICDDGVALPPPFIRPTSLVVVATEAGYLSALAGAALEPMNLVLDRTALIS